jgi:hypothetical protein
MPGKKPKTSMYIEPMPKAPTSFTDRNLDPPYAPSPKSGERISSDTAKPGGSISPIQRTSTIPRTRPMKG